MINYIEYLDIPFSKGWVIIGAILVINLVGEILEFKGKIVPEWVKIRKFFARRKSEKEETKKTLMEVKQLLADVNYHYSEDNITKRDNWMKWVNDRAVTYDESIAEISKSLGDVINVLQDNTKITEEVFVQSSRDRIIDFATKVSNENIAVSREEFNRIFKVHQKYEDFLAERNLTNGEIDIVFQIIVESYEKHMKQHTFIEDIRGYSKK